MDCLFRLKLCPFFPLHSKDPLPSLSSVRRDEVDDMYVLPALPAAEEKDKSRSEAWERLLFTSYYGLSGG